MNPYRFLRWPPRFARNGRGWRNAIYSGSIVRLAANADSVALAEGVRALLRDVLGEEPERAQFRLEGALLLERIGEVRSALAREARFLEGARAVVVAAGQDPSACAIDVPRLRAVLHRGHEIAEASAVYVAHRDTWYANPPSQINWWIPLQPVTEEDSFAFFPDAFGRALPNSSGEFDYRDFAGRVGWQSAKGSSAGVYPATAAPPESAAVRVVCDRDEVLVFSAAHLHQTRAHAAGRTRFSIDFRTVCLDDHRRGLGAPDVDNASTGSALEDYVVPR